MKIKKSLRKIVFVISILLLLCSAFIDFLINKGFIKSFIIVDDNYIHSVFSAIITVSTLSLTVLSVIISISDVKIYGLKLKEIIFLECTPINFKLFVLITMIFILCSIPALAFNMNNFLTICAIFSVVYITYSGYILFKVMYDELYTYKIINEEIKNGGLLINYLVSWVEEYKRAIVQRDESEIKKYSEFLYNAVTDNESYRQIMQNYLYDLFVEANKYYAFDESYNLVFKLYHQVEYVFDSVKVCKQYILNIEYYTEEEVKKLNFTGIINNIIFSEKINSYRKDEIVYYCFRCLINNQILSQNFKIKLLRSGFSKITKFNNDDSDRVKYFVIIQLFLDIIFENNLKLSQKMFLSLLTNLFYSNLHQKGYYYVLTISNILKLLYFYLYLDKKILNQNKKQEIILWCKNPIGFNPYRSFPLTLLFHTHEEQMLEIFIKDIKSYSIEKINDSKFNDDIIIDLSELWSLDKKISFSLWFLFSRFVHDKRINKYEYFESEIENDSEFVYRLCVILLKSFNTDKTLNADCIEHINNLNKMIGSYRYFTNKEIEKNYFDFFNNMIQKLNYKKINDLTEKGEIIKSIGEHYSIKYDFLVINDMNSSRSKSGCISFISSTNSPNLIEKSSKELKNFLVEKFKEELYTIMPTKVFSFDTNGVQKYINNLKKYRYNKKTFEFYPQILQDKTNTISISDELFKELVAIEKNIPYVYKRNIYVPMMLNDNNLYLAYKIMDIQYENLEKVQIDMVLDQKKFSNDSFMIDNSFYNYENAYEYIQKSRKNISIFISYETNITRKSGIICKIDKKVN